MEQLSPHQAALVASLVSRLARIGGVLSIVLGGSRARGRARPESDVDLGILYSDAAPFAIADLRHVLEALDDTPAPTVTGFYEWGRWVNGGAWLSIDGQRVDVLYRSIEHLQRVIDAARNGQYEIDYAQQPPFGFFSATYLGEIDVCVPLWDPHGTIATLKSQVAEYPAELRRRVVQGCLWAVEFNLQAFAAKFAARSDVYGTVGCLARAVNQLVLVLFALNRRYLLNDKTALVEVAEFERRPADFATRVQQVLAHPGESAAELDAAVANVRQLAQETRELASALYEPRYVLP